MRRGSRCPGVGNARSTASGYSLVMLVMIITVMNIGAAIVLPMWSGMIQRDKEEELIARGLQYAEAIRVFQRRTGRLPVQLDELIKVEPRSIRRLWEDPMTGKADWVLILEGAPPGTPGGSLPIDPATGRPRAAVPGTQSPPADPNLPQPIGPIRGVRSRATGEGFHVFLDQSEYSSWEFRSDLFTRFRTAPSENGIPRVSAMTLGRPFRYAGDMDPRKLGGSMPGPGGIGRPGGPGGDPSQKPKPRPGGGARPAEKE